MTKKQNYLVYALLLIFPLVFLILQILIIIDYRYFFLSTFDPAYGFLFNGLQIAQGNFELGLAQHPGTTLHCFVALNILIIHFFSGGTPLPDDVIANPEFYLKIISYEFVLINTLALFIIGLRTYRRHKNLALSLSLQLLPFVSVQGICFASVVMLEPLLLFIEILILIILSDYAFGNTGKIFNRDLIFISVLTAMGIATKVVFIPVFFLSLFYIDGIRKKWLYAGLVLLSFIIFLIPIYKVLPDFFGWIKNLFLHSGIYGSGEAKIIDAESFTNSIGLIFKENIYFSAGFVLVLVTLFISILPGNRQKIEGNRLKILSGVALVVICNVIMTAKHYSPHYMIISHNLTVFAIALSVFIYSDLGVLKYLKDITPWKKLAIVFITGFLLLFSLILKINFYHNLECSGLKTLEYVESKVKDSPRIILAGHNSSPFLESALFFGYAFTGGEKKPEYLNILKRNYPESYFYNVSEDRIFNWNDEENLADILSRSNTTFLYSVYENGTIPSALMEKLNKLKEDSCNLSVETVFKNADTKECIYEIDVSKTKLSDRIVKHEMAFCDCENVSADLNGFLSGDTLYTFGAACLRSSENSYSGEYSVKLTKESPYGLNIKFITEAGFYRISAMRKSDRGKGLIVAGGGTDNSYYRAVGSAIPVSDGWELISMTIDVREEIVGKSIEVYLWNNGETNCYFDDLRITHYKIK
jgi:hypothetical protein